MSERLVVGSEEHKKLFCRTLIDTHDPYDPDRIEWPRIAPQERERIAALPFWRAAMADENNARRKLELLAAAQTDALLAEALALQGREEGRHGRVIEAMLKAYDIAGEPPAPAAPPRNAQWAYVKLGYGECFDSFFAFGLFHIAGKSGFFPKPLVELFEPIVQEEARHILFFQNWIAYVRANGPALHRPVHRLNCARALALSIWSRIRIGAAMKAGHAGDDAVKNGALPENLSLRGFLELCAVENERRLAGYDSRLLRPRLIPSLVAAAIKVLPRGGSGGPSAVGATPA